LLLVDRWRDNTVAIDPDEPLAGRCRAPKIEKGPIPRDVELPVARFDDRRGRSSELQACDIERDGEQVIGRYMENQVSGREVAHIVDIVACLEEQPWRVILG